MLHRCTLPGCRFRTCTTHKTTSRYPSSTRSVNTHLLNNRLRRVCKGNKIRGLVLPSEEGLVTFVASARGKFLRLDQLPDGAVIAVRLGVTPSLGLSVDANRCRELRANIVQKLLGEGENDLRPVSSGRGKGGMDDPSDHLAKRPNHRAQSTAKHWRPNNDATSVLLQ